MLSNIFFPVSLSFLVAALRQLRITTRESLGECPEGMLMSHRIRVETIPFIIFKAALLLSLLFKLHQIYERRRLRKKNVKQKRSTKFKKSCDDDDEWAIFTSADEVLSRCIRQARCGARSNELVCQGSLDRFQPQTAQHETSTIKRYFFLLKNFSNLLLLFDNLRESPGKGRGKRERLSDTK